MLHGCMLPCAPSFYHTGLVLAIPEKSCSSRWQSVMGGKEAGQDLALTFALLQWEAAQ
jgi:hypothetical protein